jgi:hypothetical protein
MKLGEKTKLTGIIRRTKLDPGTPAARDGHVLEMAGGFPLEIKLSLGASPHAFAESFRILEGLVDQRVEINGVMGSGVAAIFVGDLRDIALINSGGPKHGPKAPRP